MTTVTAPPLLRGARAYFLASEPFSVAYAAGLIATQLDHTTPAVVIGVDFGGLPNYLDDKAATVTLSLPGKEWATSRTTARFPSLTFTIWSNGSTRTQSGEWLCRTIADVLVSVFDNPSNEAQQWGDVAVISSRYARDLQVVEVDGVDGLYRADLSFDVESL